MAEDVCIYMYIYTVQLCVCVCCENTLTIYFYAIPAYICHFTLCMLDESHLHISSINAMHHMRIAIHAMPRP